MCLLLNDRLHIQIVGKSFNNSLGQKLKSIKNTKRFTIIKKHFLCLILGFAIYKWERRNGNFVHNSTDNMRNSLLDNPALNVRKYTSNALFINSWIYKCKSVSFVKRKKNPLTITTPFLASNGEPRCQHQALLRGHITSQLRLMSNSNWCVWLTLSTHFI